MYEDFDEDIYNYGVEDKEEEPVECNFEINKQFEQSNIENFASQLNDALTDKFNLEDENIEVGIEGQISYIEIKIIHKIKDLSLYLQINYFMLCFYGNRNDIESLAEKIFDVVILSLEEDNTKDIQSVMDDLFKKTI